MICCARRTSPPDVKSEKPKPAKKSKVVPKKAAPKKTAPKKAAPAAVPKKKAVPKAVPKAAKAKKVAAAKPKKKPKIVRSDAPARIIHRGKINPLTQQAYDPEGHGKVSLDNVKRRRMRPREVLESAYF